jgi:hypothetical protein
MPFAYYARLTRAQQRVYRQSDAIGVVPLADAAGLRPPVEALRAALGTGDRARAERGAQALVDGLTGALRVPPMRVEVKGVRPARKWGELHGLYTPGERGRRPLVSLWMRTAQRGQVVSFRTFLRTLVHEVCHHLDYELLRLADSFHTQGFYRRESSLMRQLTGEAGGEVKRPEGAGRSDRILTAAERPIPSWRKASSGLVADPPAPAVGGEKTGDGWPTKNQADG